MMEYTGVVLACAFAVYGGLYGVMTSSIKVFGVGMIGLILIDVFFDSPDLFTGIIISIPSCVVFVVLAIKHDNYKFENGECEAEK